jgi:hypothetical protein
VTLRKITVVANKNTRLKATPPLKIKCFKKGELLIAKNNKINLYVYARTKKQLIDEINDQIIVMWKEYAKADDMELSEEAIYLKAVLTNIFSEEVFSL